jgi:hypothetical protein
MRMKILCKISEYVTSYQVVDYGYMTNDVMIVNDKCAFLGEIIEYHDRARDLGFSDGEIPKIGEGENLQNGEGDAE